MELLKNFGFDPVLLIAQVINFLIIIYILKRFLYKPLLEMLKKRQASVKEGLRQAEEGRKLLEEAEIKEKEIIKKARTTGEQIIADAKEQASKKADQVIDNSKKQAERLLGDARVQMELSEKETQKRLATYVSRLAIELLTKSSKELFSEKQQKEIAQNALKNLKQ